MIRNPEGAQRASVEAVNALLAETLSKPDAHQVAIPEMVKDNLTWTELRATAELARTGLDGSVFNSSSKGVLDIPATLGIFPSTQAESIQEVEGAGPNNSDRCSPLGYQDLEAMADSTA